MIVKMVEKFIPSSSESLKTARFFRIGEPLRLDAALPLRDLDLDRDRETMQNNQISKVYKYLNGPMETYNEIYRLTHLIDYLNDF